MNIVIIILLAILYRAYCYEKRRGFLVSAKKLYFKFIDDQNELKKPEVRNNKKLAEKYGESYQQLLLEATTIKKYIMDTGIPEPYRPNAELVGFGGIQTSNFSVLDEFYAIHNRSDVGDIFYRTIMKAIGHYKQRRNESFNPLFWIEYLIFFPKQLLGWIGVSSKTILNISQAIYWLILSLGIYLTLFKK